MLGGFTRILSGAALLPGDAGYRQSSMDAMSADLDRDMQHLKTEEAREQK